MLVSWAVPKGPTLDPKARHLAVHVEDYPLEYLHFEGVIPAGEYGSGDVIVWDRGSWRPARTDDPTTAISEGELHFDLHGEKLAGRFVLTRRDRDGDREQWLLLHKDDDYAVPAGTPRTIRPRSRAGAPTTRWPRGRTRWRSNAPPRRRSSGYRHSPSTPGTRRVTTNSQRWTLGSVGRWRIAGRDLKLTNLDKVLFSGTGDTASRGSHTAAIGRWRLGVSSAGIYCGPEGGMAMRGVVIG